MIGIGEWPPGYTLVTPDDPEAKRRSDRAYGYRREDGRVLLGFASQSAARMGAVFEWQREQRKRGHTDGE